MGAGIVVVRTGGGHRRYVLNETRAAWLRHKIGQVRLPGGQPIAVDLADDRHPPMVAWTRKLAGLEEDQVWDELVAPLNLEESPAARHVAQYVFTEILNNAIDHSGGAHAQIRVWRSDVALVIEIRDDGVGAFRRLVEGKNLPSLYAAVQELTKGKQTTAPDRHSGEGILDHAVGASPTTVGTVVRLEIDFSGVETVGQGFVDELFRVWPQTNPETTLTPTNMNEAIEFMVSRGL